MDEVYVQLLGRPRAQLGPKQIDFAPDKRYQLLAYLAYAGNWVGREQVAFLFWPDVPTTTARQDLRQLLRRTRELSFASGLEADRHRLRWQVTTDTAAFKQVLEQNPAEAAELYTGPLFQDLEGYEGVEFETWLELEREHLHGRWRDVLLAQAKKLSVQGEPSKATTLLNKLLEQDRLDEEALRLYLTAAAQAGQREQGLRAYQAFVSHIRRELGLEPASLTQQLAQDIQEQQVDLGVQQTSFLPAPLVSASRPTTPASLSLSVPANSFVGRQHELGEVCRYLSAPDCRLLTLTGPGGIGKTRIALEAARQLKGNYQDGCYVVALEALSSPDAIAPNIAEALGVDLQGVDDPLVQMMRYVDRKHLLLVLDNFEHLMEGATLVSSLIQHCPKLDLLITSRERLNLSEEWLLPVEGLPFSTGNAANLEDAWSSDAVKLFAERAKRVSPSFALTTENLPQVLAICTLLEGFPLALELAAVWVRSMSCADIVKEIEANIDFLASSARNAIERHGSIRATFEYSWKLLQPVEQKALRRLSVFRGGFRKEAASVVTGASIAVLASLLDKSLLRLTPDGRYDRHPLLYHYSQEKLAEHPKEQERSRARHATYYFYLLQRLKLELDGAKQKEVLSVLEEEHENIRSAWDWAVFAKRLRGLQQTVRPLIAFYDLQARYSEGIDLFAEAAASLSETERAHHAALGSLYVAQAWLYPWLGRYKEATALARRGLDLLRPLENSWEKVAALNTLGFNTFITGNFAEAIGYWQEALDLARAQDDTLRTVEMLSNLSLANAWSGNYARAKTHLGEALGLAEGVGRHTLMVYSFLALGFTSVVTGNLQQGQALHQRGLELAREIGEVRYLPHLLYGLGLCSYELKDYPNVQALCQEALAVALNNNDPLAQTWALTFLGRATGALGDVQQAQMHLSQSLRLAIATNNKMAAAFILVLFCELRLQQEQLEGVPEVLGFTLHYPAANRFTKDLSRQLLKRMQTEILQTSSSTMFEGGSLTSLEEATARFLHQPLLDA